MKLLPIFLIINFNYVLSQSIDIIKVHLNETHYEVQPDGTIKQNRLSRGMTLAPFKVEILETIYFKKDSTLKLIGNILVDSATFVNVSFGSLKFRKFNDESFPDRLRIKKRQKLKSGKFLLNYKLTNNSHLFLSTEQDKSKDENLIYIGTTNAKYINLSKLFRLNL